MLAVFAFDRIAVALADLYFVNPVPKNDQFGAERGVRVEVRLVEAEEMGGVYSARRIVLDRPIWRADLLSSADGPVRSFDRAHHHPSCEGWEPGVRRFDRGMTADPLGWTMGRLGDIESLVVECGFDPGLLGPADVTGLAAAVEEISAAVEAILDGIEAGELAQAPPGPPDAPVRLGWL